MLLRLLEIDNLLLGVSDDNKYQTAIALGIGQISACTPRSQLVSNHVVWRIEHILLNAGIFAYSSYGKFPYHK
jgi:hypothetical protein